MIFLRHPRTVAAPGTCYGRLDLDCGPGVGEAIAALLETLPAATSVLSSPARRCRLLADRIGARDGVPVIADSRLHELDFGAWEGSAWAAIDRAESDRWAADPFTVAPPGGETFAALHARVAAALAEAPEGAVVVTHAGVIRAARMILTGVSFDAVFAEAVPYCAPIRLGRTDIQERLETGGPPL